jgi:hypothetical protein
MFSASLKSTALLFCISLAACGGGSGGASAPVSTSATTAPSTTSSGSTNTPGSSGSSGATSPSPTFAATATSAPADGDTLSGITTFVIQGSEIANAELLMGSGYSPRLGRFTVSPDKTSARLDFDTTTVPNGTLTIRISAFDTPPGQPGNEIVAMSARTVVLRNQPPPTGNAEGRVARCVQRGVAYTDPADSPPVVCITRPLPSPPIPNDQCVSNNWETGYSNPEDGLPVLRSGQLISKLYCTPPANNGSVNPGCFCMPPQ